MEEKITRYKMYKSRDKWVVAGISMCGGILAMISGNGGIASANSISQINSAPNKAAQETNIISNNSITSQSLKQQSNTISQAQDAQSTVKNNQASTNNIDVTNMQQNNLQNTYKVQDNKNVNTIKNNTTSTQNNLVINQNAAKSQVQSNAKNSQSNINNQNLQIKADKNSNNQSTQNINNKQNNFVSSAPNAPITDKLPSAVDNNHTPDYHIHDAQGWSNDVQTITQDPDGTYNIYFLHSVDGATNPFGQNGQDWEHVMTKDWKTFQDQGIAINSHGTNNPNSWKSAWTGSIITNNGDIVGVPKGAEVAYFSGLSKADGSQNIWAAWSDDNGKTFTHALNDGAPVLAWNQTGASGKKDQERDADVIYFNNELLMYTAEGNQLGVYKSTDGIHWVKADPDGASKVQSSTFFHGLDWKDSNNIPVECPQIRLMKANDGTTKAVLFFGAKDPNGNPPQTTGTYYIIGHLDKNGMFAYEDGNNATRLDLGSDYYGANISGNDSLSDAHDSLIGLGWVGNWNYTSQGVYNNQNAHKYPQDKSQLENHLGSYSLPRKIQLISDGNGKYHLSLTSENSLSPISKGVTSTINNPSNGNNKLEDMDKDSNYGDVYDLIDHANQPADSIQQLTFNTTDGSQYNGRIYIDINQGKDKLVFNYDPDNGMMMVNGYAEELDNDMSGESASSAYYDGALGKGKGYLVNTGFIPQKSKSFTINVFCDKTSVELEFPNGVWYTVARYASQDTQDFKVYTQDPRRVNEVTNTRMQINSIEAQNNQKPNNNQSPNNKPSSSNTNSSPNNKPSSSNTNSSQNKPSSSTNTSNTNNQKPNTSNTNKNEPSTNVNNKPNSSTSNNPSQNGNSSNTNNQKPSNNTPSTNNQKPNNKPSNNQKPGSSDNNSNQNKPNTSNTNSSNSQSSNNTQSSNKPNSNINNSNQSGSAGSKGAGSDGVDKNNQNNGGNKQSGNTNNGSQSKNDNSQSNNGNTNSNNTPHNNQPSNSDNSNTHSSSANSPQQTKPNNSSNQSNNQNKPSQSGNSSSTDNNQRPNTNNTSNNNKPSSSTTNQNKPNNENQSSSSQQSNNNSNDVNHNINDNEPSSPNNHNSQSNNQSNDQSSINNENKPNQSSSNSNTQTSDINDNSNNQSSKNNQNKNNSNNINSSNNDDLNIAKDNTQDNNTNINSSSNLLNNSAQSITKNNSSIDNNNKGNNIVNTNNEFNEESIISNSNRVNNNATSISSQQNQNINSINNNPNISITKLSNSLNNQVNNEVNNSNELPQTGDSNTELLIAMTGLIGLLGISELKKKD